MIKAVRIQELAQGDQAVVTQVSGHDDDLARLCALGFRSGIRIQIVRSGQPCIVQLEETRLCLRPDSTLRILVAPE